jgi:hypothetical protein
MQQSEDGVHCRGPRIDSGLVLIWAILEFLPFVFVGYIFILFFGFRVAKYSGEWNVRGLSFSVLTRLGRVTRTLF